VSMLMSLVQMNLSINLKAQDDPSKKAKEAALKFYVLTGARRGLKPSERGYKLSPP
jgi:hypothetical protein